MCKKILFPQILVLVLLLQIIQADTLAHWRFDQDSGLRDLSGAGLHLRLRGADTSLGKLDEKRAGLRIVSKAQSGDQAQGAIAAHHENLSPTGAFTLEVRVTPDPELADLPAGSRVHLIDKNYVHFRPTANPADNKDYSLYMLKQEEGGWIFEVKLGFGESSIPVRSPAISLSSLVSFHIGFTYDGSGNAAFYLDGERLSQRRIPNAGPVVGGKHPLVIGDRIGSQYGRFLGWIHEVKISKGVKHFTPDNKIVVAITSDRRAFTRMETADLEVRIQNRTQEDLPESRLRLQIKGIEAGDYEVPAVKSGEQIIYEVPVNSSLKPGRYQYIVSLVDQEGQALYRELNTWITVVPRAMGEVMPVVMWNTGDMREIKEIGFTHFIAIFNWLGELQEDGKSRFRSLLDRVHAAQLKAVVMVSPGRSEELRKQYPRLDRSGNPYSILNVNGLIQEVQDIFYREGKYRADVFGDLPAFESVLVNTEIRDHTQLSFSEMDREAYRQHSGRPIPEGVAGPRGVLYSNISGFPRNRVIKENYPLLSFYQWFWREGDGWNTLNNRVVAGLKESGKIASERFWTWYDPAVRVPSIYGSGGNVDYLSHWTYTYPDPLKIALASEQLFAMSRGNPDQQVMKMTQLIWYRDQTTNPVEGPVVGERAAWESEVPDARFISIAPDHLREALWLKLSYPIKGIMYHGWASLVEAPSGSSYRLTNRETRQAMMELIREVVRPLGPTLMQVPDAEMDVAWLESFSSQIFAGRGAYGWGRGWGADAYMIARHAGLQSEIVYDETIRQQGLSKYKILFAMHADVLTEEVVKEIQKFQRSGGIVIADEFLTPAIRPDILISSFRRSGKAHEDKQQLLQKAADLSAELEGLYSFAYSRDNPEVILRKRSYGTSDYLFVANDQRTYGNYVGQYRMVMEEGIPSETTVVVHNDKFKVIYDLMRGTRVDAQRVGNSVETSLRFPVHLEPGDGNVFLLMEKPLGEILLNLDQRVARGNQLQIRAAILDEDGNQPDAVLPVELRVIGPEGNEAEYSGYYAAVNGVLQLQLDIADNDLTGEWQVLFTSLATKETQIVSFIVEE